MMRSSKNVSSRTRASTFVCSLCHVNYFLFIFARTRCRLATRSCVFSCNHAIDVAADVRWLAAVAAVQRHSAHKTTIFVKRAQNKRTKNPDFCHEHKQSLCYCSHFQAPYQNATACFWIILRVSTITVTIFFTATANNAQMWSIVLQGESTLQH